MLLFQLKYVVEVNPFSIWLFDTCFIAFGFIWNINGGKFKLWPNDVWVFFFRNFIIVYLDVQLEAWKLASKQYCFSLSPILDPPLFLSWPNQILLQTLSISNIKIKYCAFKLKCSKAPDKVRTSCWILLSPSSKHTTKNAMDENNIILKNGLVNTEIGVQLVYSRE